MRKYKVIPKGLAPKSDEYWEESPVIYDLTVMEQAESPSDTGLIDTFGNPYYSFPEKRCIGFIHFSPNE